MARRTEITGDDLEARSREVLREIVRQFVSSGEPVSSRSLSKVGAFDLSPATLRNVMADLEDLGYLHQPHTSAGRVPTDRGYRFFINHLMRSRKLSQQERAIIDGEVEKASELDEVLHLSSRLLSRMSEQVGVAFLPTLQQLAMRSVNLVTISERKLMCVIVGTNGVVVNKIIELDTAIPQEEAEWISRYLTGEFGGMVLLEIRDRLQALMNEERARVDEMWRRTLAVGAEAVEVTVPPEHDLWVDGALSMLTKPDFAQVDADALRKTIEAFEQKERLVAILNQCLNESGLQIVIGSESEFTGDHNFAMVASRYEVSGTPMGLVAVIGPTRMEYGRVAPLVDYLGRALSRKIKQRGPGDEQ